MEIWWRRAAISAWRAVWVRNVEAKSVNSVMKTGLILKLDDLINWCNSRVFSSDEVFGNHRAASALNHPNIISIYDIAIGNGRGPDYIVMEYVSGKTRRPRGILHFRRKESRPQISASNAIRCC